MATLPISSRLSGWLRGAAAVLLAAFVAASSGPAAQAQTAGRPMTPSPAANPPAAGDPAIPAAATGMCQCISDHVRRHIVCLPSPQECQTTCGNNQFSFVPNAPSCPLTARERGR